MELPDINFDRPLMVDENLHAKIYASQELAKLIRLSGPDTRPIVEWERFAGMAVDTTLGRQYSAAIDLYTKAKQNDLVFVPDHKHRKIVYIGRFLEGPNEWVSVRDIGRYFDYDFPARRVEWLTTIDETQMSPDLSYGLRHEHAFGDLGRNLYNEAFSFAYGNFIGNGVFSSLVANASPEFTDSDNAFIGVIFTLAAYACQAYENGEETFKIDDIFEFVLNRPPIEYACLFSSKHNSPGFTRYLGEKGTALVAAGAIAGLMSLSSEADASEVQRKAESIEFVNSLSASSGPCDINVDGPGRIFFRSIKGDRLIKACKTMADTANRAKLGVRSRPR